MKDKEYIEDRDEEFTEKQKLESKYGPGDYIIVQMYHSSKIEFANEVNRLRKFDYEPTGGLCVVGGSASAMMFQAMIKKTKPQMFIPLNPSAFDGMGDATLYKNPWVSHNATDREQYSSNFNDSTDFCFNHDEVVVSSYHTAVAFGIYPVQGIKVIHTAANTEATCEDFKTQKMNHHMALVRLDKKLRKRNNL